jgi:thiol:disulfide interchange protein DsbC
MNKIWVILPLAFGFATAMAEDGAPLSKAEIAAKLDGVDAADIKDSPLAGIYQVSVGSSVGYVSADGKYLLQGELYDLGTSQNLTEKARAAKRVGLLSGVQPDQMIVFGPKDGKVKHTVTVFTDIDCGYCRQFHRDIDKVTALGIEVHYLFFPRTGPDTDSWAKAEKVWCAKDRRAALTEAKRGGGLPEEACADNPVGRDYDLGRQIGVRGTPAMFASNGELIGGYLTPTALEQALEEADAE